MEDSFEGKVLIITAPSGAGKTTIVQHLLKRFPDSLAFSVSATSRNIRQGEQDGIDYYFLSPGAFMEKVERGEFLEWEEVYKDQYYGTLYSEIDRIWKDRKHIIFDVDVKGAKKLKTHFVSESVAVFVRPPSLQVLVDRLRRRNTETIKSLKKRINRIKEELTYEFQFDKVLVNDILEVTLKEAELLVEEFI